MAKAVKSPKFNIKVKPLTGLKAWKDLKAHAREIAKLSLRTLFADDAQRGTRMTAEGVGLFLDYSKNRITDETLKLLLALLEESKLRGEACRSACGPARVKEPIHNGRRRRRGPQSS